MRNFNKVAISCLLACSLSFVSGCASHHKRLMTPSQQLITAQKNRQIAKGAVAGLAIGATAGAALGAFINGTPGFGALVGGGVGLLTGALYARNQELEKYHIYTMNMDDQIIMLIPCDAIFETNTANFLPDSYSTLKLAADILKQFPKENIHISGNTDQIVHPSEKIETDLSTQQAMMIAGFMWTNGVNQGKYHRHLTYTGFRSSYPIATNTKMTGMATNRRIQITIYPNTDKGCPDKHCANKSCNC